MHHKYERSWNPDELTLESVSRLCINVGFLDDASPLQIPFTVMVGVRREPRLVMIAGIHGDEYEGVAALHDVVHRFEPTKIKGTLTIVPVANPEAFYANCRKTPIDGCDLNRSFPGNVLGTPTERLAHAILHEFVLGNDMLLSMHGWSKELTTVPYVEYPSSLGAAAAMSRVAAEALGLDFIVPYAWPVGQLTFQALVHGIPAIEPEVGGLGTITSEGQRTYGRIIDRLLSHLGIVGQYDGPSVGSSAVVAQTNVLSTSTGLFRSYVRLWDSVKTGDRLSSTFGINGDVVEEIRSPAAGTVAILRASNSVKTGDLLFGLFEDPNASKRPREPNPTAITE